MRLHIAFGRILLRIVADRAVISSVADFELIWRTAIGRGVSGSRLVVVDDGGGVALMADDCGRVSAGAVVELIAGR